MRKLVIILPVLLSVFAICGFANAESTNSLRDFNFQKASAQGFSLEQMIPFAKTSDDGGALGEKAKVKAMREALHAGTTTYLDSGHEEQINTARPTAMVSLTAIREEEV